MRFALLALLLTLGLPFDPLEPASPEVVAPPALPEFTGLPQPEERKATLTDDTIRCLFPDEYAEA